MAIGNKTGLVEFTVNDLRVNLKPAEVAEKGVRCSVAIVPENPGKRDGDVVLSGESCSPGSSCGESPETACDGRIHARLRRGDKIFVWEDVD